MAQTTAPTRESATETRPTAASKPKPRHRPSYHVVLWDDDDHTYAYVIEMLKKLFGHPDEKGFKLANEVDTEGRCIVETTTKERAELKRDQIHAYGADWRIPRCQGSMSASIEASESE